MDWLLLACRVGGAICGRRGKQRIVAPRSADSATVGSDCGGVQPARACKMVCFTLPDFLARSNDLHLAVSARVGSYCDWSFFTCGNSHDRDRWRCMRARNRGSASLAYGSAAVEGARHSNVVWGASIIRVSAQPDPLYCASITSVARVTVLAPRTVAWHDPNLLILREATLRARNGGMRGARDHCRVRVMKLVEAAGIEPASEKARREKPTCVSGSAIVGRRIMSRQESGGLARLISALRLRAEAFSLSCEMTPAGYRAGPIPGAAT